METHPTAVRRLPGMNIRTSHRRRLAAQRNELHMLGRRQHDAESQLHRQSSHRASDTAFSLVDKSAAMEFKKQFSSPLIQNRVPLPPSPEQASPIQEPSLTNASTNLLQVALLPSTRDDNKQHRRRLTSRPKREGTLSCGDSYFDSRVAERISATGWHVPEYDYFGSIGSS